MKVAEKLALLGFLLSSGCTSDHLVSPWGQRLPQLGALMRPADLGKRLEEIDAETAHLGLTLVLQVEAKLPAARGVAMVRAYEGVDVVGRRVTAVRAASGRGVVLALGPLDARELGRDQATELVASLAPADGGDPSVGAWRSGTDLNGDGLPDVVARNEAGVLEVWGLDVFGANRYPVELESPPMSATDVDGDGRPDLVGRVAVPAGDPLAPELLDVATPDARGWSHASAGARAMHEIRAARSFPPSAPSDETRLRRALERAWHRALGGEARDAVLAELDRERVPLALRASFEGWRRRIARAGGAAK